MTQDTGMPHNRFNVNKLLGELDEAELGYGVAQFGSGGRYLVLHRHDQHGDPRRGHL